MCGGRQLRKRYYSPVVAATVWSRHAVAHSCRSGEHVVKISVVNAYLLCRIVQTVQASVAPVDSYGGQHHCGTRARAEDRRVGYGARRLLAARAAKSDDRSRRQFSGGLRLYTFVLYVYSDIHAVINTVHGNVNYLRIG